MPLANYYITGNDNARTNTKTNERFTQRCSSNNNAHTWTARGKMKKSALNLNKGTPMAKSFYYCLRSCCFTISFAPRVIWMCGMLLQRITDEPFGVIAYVFPGNRIRSLSNDGVCYLYARAGLVAAKYTPAWPRTGSDGFGKFAESSKRVESTATKSYNLTSGKKNNEMNRQNNIVGRCVRGMVTSAADDGSSNAVSEIGPTQLCCK